MTQKLSHAVPSQRTLHGYGTWRYDKILFIEEQKLTRLDWCMYSIYQRLHLSLYNSSLGAIWQVCYYRLARRQNRLRCLGRRRLANPQLLRRRVKTTCEWSRHITWRPTTGRCLRKLNRSLWFYKLREDLRMAIWRRQANKCRNKSGLAAYVD